jgi:phenylacetate-CoA ligase
MARKGPIERQSREQLTEAQSARLAEQVRYAYERVPFYTRALDDAGVDPAEVRSVEDLSVLPFTTKSDIAAHYPYGLTAIDPTTAIRLHSSSGTTGKPIHTFYTRRDLKNWGDCVARAQRIAGVRSGDVVQIAFRYTLFTGAFGHHRGAERNGCLVVPTSSGQTERQLMMMQDLGSTVLCCTPSYGLVIAERAYELGIDPDSLPLRIGIHGAEGMSDRMRDAVEGGLGVRVARDYGLTELGGPGVSIECEAKSGYHINEDHFLPEIVDPESGRQLPDGEVGELVFTALQRESSPLLRYRTRDLTHLTRERCSCGRTLTRHGQILGRTDDMMIVGGVNLFPSQIESVLFTFEEVAPHYLIRLVRRGSLDAVSVDVEAAPDFWAATSPQTVEDACARVSRRLQDLLGLRIDVCMLEPASLERTEGKSKRVSDERG